MPEKKSYHIVYWWKTRFVENEIRKSEMHLATQLTKKRNDKNKLKQMILVCMYHHTDQRLQNLLCIACVYITQSVNGKINTKQTNNVKIQQENEETNTVQIRKNEAVRVCACVRACVCGSKMMNR